MGGTHECHSARRMQRRMHWLSALISGMTRYAGHAITSTSACSHGPLRHATTVFTSGMSRISSESVWKPIV